MALQDRLIDNLRLSLPGATDAVIQAELFNTVDDACREAWIWDEQQLLTLVVGQLDYDPTPAGTLIVTVNGVSHSTIDKSHMAFEYGLLRLAVQPTIADASFPAVINMILTPASTNTDAESWVPGDMWTEYFDMFKSGTLGRMMAQPAKPYSNPSMAAYWMRDYRGRRAAAKVRLRNGNTFGATRWRFPRFA